MAIDICELVSNSLPELFLLVDKEKIRWEKIEEKYSKRLEEAAIIIQNNPNAETETSIYEIIIFSNLVGKEYRCYLELLKGTLKTLNNHLSEKEKALLKPTIKSILENLDHKYLNFIGELAILSYIKFHLKWNLDKVEVPYSTNKENGKRIDFLFSGGQFKHYIEVMNIHLTKKLSNNYDDVEKFLFGRIFRKLSDKTKGQIHDLRFIIFPFIWGLPEELVLIKAYIEERGWNILNSTSPIGYVCLEHKGTKEIKYMLRPIEKMTFEEKKRD